MNLEKRIEAFAGLGEILRCAVNNRPSAYTEKINSLIDNQHLSNQWFTPVNVRMALKAIADELTYENLEKWTDNYPLLKKDYRPVKVAVIMAGNIPLAGFHDFLSVLISGNSIVAKTSSKDSGLIVHISEILCSLEISFEKRIEFTEGVLNGFDTVIATGSDNSSRYFEYYFGKYPNIIRKNRNSVAVLTGDESASDLEDLGLDIFSYAGLGCRNVSKIFIPAGYDLLKMTESWNKYCDTINHSAYANNYDFNKAVYLVNKEKFIDTGFLLLKENSGLSSPVAVLYYEFYESLENADNQLNIYRDKIQCIVGRKWNEFGKAQFPKLWDYADNVDTLDFLLKKNLPGIL
jgi:hypothetical protein